MRGRLKQSDELGGHRYCIPLSGLPKVEGRLQEHVTSRSPQGQATPLSYVTQCHYQVPIRYAMYDTRTYLCAQLVTLPALCCAVCTAADMPSSLSDRHGERSPIGEGGGRRSTAMILVVCGSPFWWDHGHPFENKRHCEGVMRAPV